MHPRLSPRAAGLPAGLALVFGWACVAQASPALLILQPNGDLREPGFAVTRSHDLGLELQLDLPALAVEQYDIAGESYHSLLIEGGQLQGEIGAPALPAYTRYVALPPTAGVELRIVAVEEETLPGYRILPMQDEDAPDFQRDEGLYRRDEFLGPEPVTLGAPSMLRDLRVLPVTFSPIRCNPATGEIRVVRRVELALDYAGVDLRGAPTRATVPLTPAFDSIYSSVVVNYDPETYRRAGQVAPHLGTWLLISRDNSTLTSYLQPLIQWRARMGYNVVHVTTAVTGTSPSTIRAWLQNAYNTWEYPPDYICIVGDAGGSYAIGTFHESWSGYYYGEGDHPYCQLTGDDLMPDAFIGRLSAEDATTMQRIVNKITSYEQTPYMSDTSWFGRATLTGDPSTSGPTCVQVQQWLKEQLRRINYAQVDTIFTSPYESRTISSLNQGSTFFGYRGYYTMSGISTGDISALQNGWRLAYAINLTCGTGSWKDGTSHSEAWLRGGSGTTNATAGIGSIGTATTGTATRYNNCFYSGACYGLFWNDGYQLGPSHARGKLEMILNYEALEYGKAGTYCYWNTLMGDPATEIWTGVPVQVTASYPAVVPVGSNVVTVTVTTPTSMPVADAWVYLSLGQQIRVGGWTDAAGQVDLPIDAGQPGTVSVVVTGHNLYAHQGSFQIAAASFVGLDAYTITEQPGAGNDDGLVNPGETFDLRVTLRNFTPQTAHNVVLRVSSADPNLGWLSEATIPVGDISGYSVATTPEPLLLRLYPGTPAGHELAFDLQVACDEGTWISALTVPVTGPALLFSSATLHGFGTRIDPGETGELEIQLTNAGTLAALGPITAMLASDSYQIQVTDAAGSFGSIAPGASGTNGIDRFGVFSPGGCIPGQQANLRLVLVCADGTRLTVPFSLVVGAADANDPTGPDAYGYWCYDQLDTAYADHPTYQWIDINPASGGPGTSLGLGYDTSRTIDLPFTFTFYGESFDRATVCSNGWMAMGATYLVNYRNWQLPSAGGPAYMIAGFWDDLYQSGNDREYFWYDAANHRFIVAWDRVRNDYGGGVESFEIILYDPAYYPTVTGDGIIDVMYEQIQDTDSQQMYSTAGIQNGDHTTGINYCYYRQIPPTAAPYVSGLALRYTTGAPGFTGVPATGAEPRLLLGNDPNPCRGATTIRFTLDRAQPVTLRLFDPSGRLLETLAAGELAAGAHSVDWRNPALPAGVYFYRLETQGAASTRPLLLVR